MSRKEYMAQLDMLLRDIPHTERQEALKYYEDYFADAGEEHEAEVIEELGSPEELAKKLREDLKREENNKTSENESQEQTDRDQESRSQDYQNQNYQQTYQNPHYMNYENPTPENKSGKSRKTLTVCLIILGVILGIGLLGRLAVGIGRLTFFITEKGSGETSNVEMTTADFDAATIQDLYIEAGVGALSVENWDGDTICVSYPGKYISAKQEEGELRLKTKDHWYFSWRNLFGGFQEENYRVVVKLPEDMVFDEVDVSAGAGTADIMRLEATNLYLETGAGELTAKELIVKEEVHIEAGVGETTIEKLEAGEAYFEVGVGELNISGKVNGDISAECGVGQMTLNLANEESDFNYNISCGVGEVSVNGKSYSGVGNSQDVDNNAAYDFEMDCGVGEIKVTFVTTQAKIKMRPLRNC